MALFLKAEQKNLLSFFGTDERCIIPAFQRPYSWGYEQCDRLYNDLAEAFNDDNEYFLGNIVIASAQNDNLRPHIIDGQQRLITLFMIAKILTVLQPEYVKFSRLIFVEDDRGMVQFPKMESEVPESNDNNLLEKILKMNLEEIIDRLDQIRVKNIVVPEKCEGKIEVNFLTLFAWYLGYKQRATNEEFEKYLDFFFRKIFILPITLDGRTQLEAESDALTIFETINDRGLSLQDADIIKALLYKKAKLAGEEKCFTTEWHSLTIECQDLGISIDDLFRYYFYIVKGVNANSDTSNRLRDYFVRNPNSPLLTHSTSYTIKELKKLLEILQCLNDISVSNHTVSIPIRILNYYTNQYPRYAVVAYLYELGLKSIESDEFITFLISLIRYAYGSGSTTAIKTEIFSIIRNISKNGIIKDYYFTSDLDVLNPKRVFPLRRGMILLAFWLSNNNYTTEETIEIDRIIPRKEITDEETLGNFILITGVKKRGNWNKRYETYLTTCRSIISKQIKDATLLPEELVTIRNNAITNTLSKFFYNNE